MPPRRGGARTKPASAAGAALTLALLLLAGCASGPRPGRDSGPVTPPPGLERVPDAVPRIEPIRSGGPNKPYEVMGRTYVPETRDVPMVQKGLASWYGKKFHGRQTASGEIYDMYAMTAAHKTMPLPSYARVRNPANGREVIVRVNDRGPFHAGRIIDLSYAAALKLGVLRGVAPVEVQRITGDEIRSGSWRRNDAAPAPDVPAATAPEVAARGADVPSAAAADTAPAVSASGEASADAAAALASAPAPVAATDPPTTRALTAAARGWWVQLGAFRERSGAETFRQRVGAELDWLAPLTAVFKDASLYRLQAGPYPSRDEAQASAQRVREELQLVPLIVERR